MHCSQGATCATPQLRALTAPASRPACSCPCCKDTRHGAEPAVARVMEALAFLVISSGKLKLRQLRLITLGLLLHMHGHCGMNQHSKSRRHSHGTELAWVAAHSCVDKQHRLEVCCPLPWAVSGKHTQAKLHPQLGRPAPNPRGTEKPSRRCMSPVTTHVCGAG